jgi:hypothetical protein
MTAQLVIIVKDAVENGHISVAGITPTFTLRAAEKNRRT